MPHVFNVRGQAEDLLALLLARHRCGSPRPSVQASIPEEVLSPTSPAKTSNNQQPGALVRPSASAQPVGPAMALDRLSRLPGCLIGDLTSHIKTGRLHSRTPGAASHTPASLGPFSCADLVYISGSSPSHTASASLSGPNVLVANHGNEQAFIRVHLGHLTRPRPGAAGTPESSNGSF